MRRRGSNTLLPVPEHESCAIRQPPCADGGEPRRRPKPGWPGCRELRIRRDLSGSATELSSYRQTCPYGDGGSAGIERARGLVKKSGTQGQRVVVWAPDAPTALALGNYFVSVLRELGYHASLKSVAGGPSAYFDQVADSRRRVQAGFYGWGADYPAPGGFLQALFGCADFTPASPATTTNVSEFCDPESTRPSLTHSTSRRRIRHYFVNKIW